MSRYLILLKAYEIKNPSFQNGLAIFLNYRKNPIQKSNVIIWPGISSNARILSFLAAVFQNKCVLKCCWVDTYSQKTRNCGHFLLNSVN